MKQSLYQRSSLSVAQGCLTNSKHPKSHVRGIAPTHIIKAHGAKFWDESGKSYIDYAGGLGTNYLGYGNETVNRAVIQAISMGVSHSLPTQFEVVAAEKLKEVYPFIDKVKWLKTGSEACSAAVKIARAVTGRHNIMSEGYHGWHEEFCEHYNHPSPIDFNRLADRDFAAVIIEPISLDISDERIEYLKRLVSCCKAFGTLVIFDEVITNLRFPKLSVSNWLNLQPDLICGGKAIANGFPLAYVAGKSDIMDDGKYFVSGTYAGDIAALAACHAVLTLVLSKKRNIDHLWSQGQQFIDRFHAIADGYIKLKGYPTRGVIDGDSMRVALFMQECAKAGLFFGKSWFFSFPQADPEIQNETFIALEGIFSKLKSGHVTLEGQMPESPLVMKVRG